ncbi:phosphopantetheine-binding protein [Streptomyces sp. NPDC127117]|uniref:phosphopantetheine-binding protein n=1 Tax=Streptomyces sp. NPDC127117 TaxID=3345368 RepID=UPI00362C27BC
MTANETPWPETFETVVRGHLPLLGAEPLLASTHLGNAGLDSLATISLLIDLEEQFAIAIPDEHLDADSFATVGSLWSVVAETLAITRE